MEKADLALTCLQDRRHGSTERWPLQETNGPSDLERECIGVKQKNLEGFCNSSVVVLVRLGVRVCARWHVRAELCICE